MVFERNLERVEDGRRELYKIEGLKNEGGGSTGLRGLDSFKWKLTRGGLHSSSSGSVPSDVGPCAGIIGTHQKRLSHLRKPIKSPSRDLCLSIDKEPRL
jgi:hypothetical protein